MPGPTNTALATVGLPAPAGGAVDVLVIAGEHSGDQNAARMVRSFKVQRPDVRVCALGGPALGASGAQLLRDLTAQSVIGFVDALRKISHFKRLLDEITAWVVAHRPRLICFVDSSGLNLRVAARLHAAGLTLKSGGACRLVYYISPQIWASRAKRRFAMAEHLDALAVIFPFEPACYADTSLRPEFVGHPFLAADYQAPVHYDPLGPVLLLPGSRKSAVARIFPRMLAAWDLAGRPPAAVIFPSEALRLQLQGLAGDAPLTYFKVGQPVGASAVLTTSGTMSMQCALAGIPGAVMYVAHPIEYWIGRLIVTVSHIGIASLLLKREAYPEFIQGAAKPETLARILIEARSDNARRAKAARDSEDLRRCLNEGAPAGPGPWLARQWDLAARP